MIDVSRLLWLCVQLRRKGSMAGMGGGEEGALVMLELKDKHEALRREHQDALHRIATLAQQLKEAVRETLHKCIYIFSLTF